MKTITHVKSPPFNRLFKALIFVLPIVLTSTLLSVSTDVSGQEKFNLVGSLQMADTRDAVEGATIKVYKNVDPPELLETIKSGKKGKFSLFLDFEYDHKITFSNKGSIEMYALVFTSQVPEKKRRIPAMFTMAGIPFYEPGMPRVNPAAFADPFEKVVYDGKKFRTDENYFASWEKKRMRAVMKTRPKSAPAVASYSKRLIAGKLLTDQNGSALPLNRAKVSLLDGKGKELQSALTNRQGIFVLNMLPENEQFTLNVQGAAIKGGKEVRLVNKNDNVVTSKLADGRGIASFRFNQQHQNLLNMMTVEPSEVQVSLKGKLMSADKKKPLSGVQFTLKNDRGETITTTTDTNGLFTILNLIMSQDYFISSEIKDPRLKGISQLVLMDTNNSVVKEIKLDEAQKFDFQMLAKEKAKVQSIELIDEGAAIGGNVLVGKEHPKGFGKKRLELVNPEGEVLESVMTNVLGGFVFTKLPPDQDFSILIDEKDSDLDGKPDFIITASDNSIVARGQYKNGKIHFDFSDNRKGKVAKMKVDRKKLRSTVIGKLFSGKEPQKPLPSIKIGLRSNSGKIVHTITDTKGLFAFVNLLASQNYAIFVDGNQKGLANETTVILTDRDGKVIKNIGLDEEKSFDYQLLPREQATLSLMEVEDPWMSFVDAGPGKTKRVNAGFETVIRENVYFEVDDATVLPETERQLDKVVEVMLLNKNLAVELSSHTDSRGSDDYNLTLSQKRAKSAHDYMLSRGIASDRISAKGFGETQPVNHCKNGVECSDDEHAQNRRVEFKVIVRK